MFNTRTVFVVGAGASREAGLPTGNELKSQISENIDIRFEDFDRQVSGNRAITRALRDHVYDPDVGRGNINPYLSAAWRIRDAMPQAVSIDNFIDAHDDDERIKLCGKLAIASSILKAEQGSQLFIDPQAKTHVLDYSSLESTWYIRLIQALTTGHRRNALERVFENVAFVVFNYDRVLEHFLFHALQNFYGINARESADLVGAVPIFHPYGVVGSLPWQQQQVPVEFGHEQTGRNLLSIASQIKTFTEQIDEGPQLDAMHNSVARANKLVFLGFAFHQQNMELITPPQGSEIAIALATAMGISKSDSQVIEQDILERFSSLSNFDMKAEIRNELTCNNFFYEYSRTLAN